MEIIKIKFNTIEKYNLILLSTFLNHGLLSPLSNAVYSVDADNIYETIILASDENFNYLLFTDFVMKVHKNSYEKIK
jgi:hypothetical protein